MERTFCLGSGVTDLSVVLKLFTSAQGEDYSGDTCGWRKLTSHGLIHHSQYSVSLVYYLWAWFIAMDSKVWYFAKHSFLEVDRCSTHSTLAVLFGGGMPSGGNLYGILYVSAYYIILQFWS